MSAGKTTWGPILLDGSISSAQHSINDIVADLVRITPSIQTSTFLSECALLFAYLAQVQPSSEWSEKAEEYLNLAIDGISAQSNDRQLMLYGGLAGVGWVVEHLLQLPDPRCREEESPANEGAETATPQYQDDPLEAIDQITIRRLQQGRGFFGYDLISGLVGIGIYFLQRLPRASALRGVRLVLDRLEEWARHTWPGVAWYTPPELLPPFQREICPAGYYNLGVAHGVPGVVYFLAEVVALGIDVDRTKERLEDAVSWLLAQQRPPHAITRFSSWVFPGIEPQDSRLGWCYGDLGIAGLLQHSAVRVGRDDWLESANRLLDHCLHFPIDRAGIRDVMLCHGAMGVAHIYNRAYQSSGEPRYKDTANLWFTRGLEMRKPGTGVGGFSAYKPEQSPIWHPDPSFLSGSTGVALALLSAIHPIEPRWDRILLLSDCR